jgi:hypothetical protein
MIPDLNIYRSAQMLAKRHGEDAAIEATMRADTMLDKDYLDGYAVWELRSAAPDVGERVH